MYLLTLLDYFVLNYAKSGDFRLFENKMLMSIYEQWILIPWMQSLLFVSIISSVITCTSSFHLRLVHTVRFYYLRLRYRKWIVWMLMMIFTWCDFLCMWCSGVCDVTHEWVPYPFCAIVMCDSNINTLQIASTTIALCEQFHKIACKKMLFAHRANRTVWTGL